MCAEGKEKSFEAIRFFERVETERGRSFKVFLKGYRRLSGSCDEWRREKAVSLTLRNNFNLI